MTFSSYECAWGRITPPKSVHMSHIEMTIQTCILFGILSPFFVTNRQNNQEEWEKEKKIWGMMHEGCKMNEKMKFKQKKIWHAKDDGTWNKPKHDIDTRTCYTS